MVNLNQFRHNLIRLERTSSSDELEADLTEPPVEAEEAPEYMPTYNHVDLHPDVNERVVAYAPVNAGFQLLGSQVHPGQPITFSQFSDFFEYLKPDDVKHLFENVTKGMDPKEAEKLKEDDPELLTKLAFFEIMDRIAKQGGWASAENEKGEPIYYTYENGQLKVIPEGPEAEEHLATRHRRRGHANKTDKLLPQFAGPHEQWLKVHQSARERELEEQMFGTGSQLERLAGTGVKDLPVDRLDLLTANDSLVFEIWQAIQGANPQRAHKALTSLPGLQDIPSAWMDNLFDQVSTVAGRMDRLAQLGEQIKALSPQTENIHALIQFGEVSKEWFKSAKPIIDLVTDPSLVQDQQLSPIKFIGLLAATSSGNSPDVELHDALALWNEWLVDSEFRAEVAELPDKQAKRDRIQQWIKDLADRQEIVKSKTILSGSPALALASSLEELSSLRYNVITQHKVEPTDDQPGKKASDTYKIENMRKAFLVEYLLGVEDDANPYLRLMSEEMATHPDSELDLVLDLWMARISGKPVNPKSTEYVAHEVYWKNTIKQINEQRLKEGTTPEEREPLKPREAMAMAWAGLRFLNDLAKGEKVAEGFDPMKEFVLRVVSEGRRLTDSDDFSRAVQEALSRPKSQLGRLFQYKGNESNPIIKKVLEYAQQLQQTASRADAAATTGVGTEPASAVGTTEGANGGPTLETGGVDPTGAKALQVDSKAINRLASLLDNYAQKKDLRIPQFVQSRGVKAAAKQYLSRTMLLTDLPKKAEMIFPPTRGIRKPTKSTLDLIRESIKKHPSLSSLATSSVMRDAVNYVLDGVGDLAVNELFSRHLNVRPLHSFEGVRDIEVEDGNGNPVSIERLLTDKEAAKQFWASHDVELDRDQVLSVIKFRLDYLGKLYDEMREDDFPKSEGQAPLWKFAKNLARLASSYVGLAPQMDEEQPFEQAYAAYMSGDHEHLVGQMHQLGESIGYKDHKTHKGLTDWGTGATAGAIQVIPNPPNSDFVDYSAAWYGLQGNQNTVMSFLSDENGPDSIYTLKVPEKDMNVIRSDLDKLGIEERTMVTVDDGHHLVIFDSGSRLKDKVGQLGQKYNARVRFATGNGKFYGGSSAKRARGEYRKLIRSLEAQYGDAIRAYTPQTSLGEFSQNVQGATPSSAVSPVEQQSLPVVPL